MSYLIKNAARCRSWCQLNFRVAHHGIAFLYSFAGTSVYSAIYLPKLLNKYAVKPMWHWKAGSSTLRSFTKLRNLMARMALSSPWIWI